MNLKVIWYLLLYQLQDDYSGQARAPVIVEKLGAVLNNRSALLCQQQ